MVVNKLLETVDIEAENIDITVILFATPGYDHINRKWLYHLIQ